MNKLIDQSLLFKSKSELANHVRTLVGNGRNVPKSDLIYIYNRLFPESPQDWTCSSCKSRARKQILNYYE